MVGKRVQLDDETWEALQAVMRDSGSSFQEIAKEAFADLLKKRKQPGGAEGVSQGERKHATSAEQKVWTLSVPPRRTIQSKVTGARRSTGGAAASALERSPPLSVLMCNLQREGASH